MTSLLYQTDLEPVFQPYAACWADSPCQRGEVLDETDRKALVAWDGGRECWEFWCDIRRIEGEF